MKKALYLSILGFLIQPVFAQKFSTVNQELTWLGAKVSYKLPNDWTVSAKVEERRYFSGFRVQQRVLPDLTVAKKFSDRWKADAGLWVFSIYTPETAAEPPVDTVHELRPYFTVGYSIPLKKQWELGIFLKTEARLFKEASSENPFDDGIGRTALRERIKFEFKRKLGERFTLKLAEEFHFNVAASSNYNFFDQNRITAGLTAKLLPFLELSAGYLHWWQPTGVESQYFNRHILTTGVHFTIGE